MAFFVSLGYQMKFERLKKNNDFLKVYNKGRSYGCKNLVIYYLPNGTDRTRAGFSISKKVGNAVTRNRIRRYLKESLILLEPKDRGHDIIFVARKAAKDNNFFEIKRSVQYLFKKIGLKVYENTKQMSDNGHQILPNSDISDQRSDL